MLRKFFFFIQKANYRWCSKRSIYHGHKSPTSTFLHSPPYLSLYSNHNCCTCGLRSCSKQLGLLPLVFLCQQGSSSCPVIMDIYSLSMENGMAHILCKWSHKSDTIYGTWLTFKIASNHLEPWLLWAAWQPLIECLLFSVMSHFFLAASSCAGPTTTITKSDGLMW